MTVPSVLRVLLAAALLLSLAACGRVTTPQAEPFIAVPSATVSPPSDLTAFDGASPTEQVDLSPSPEPGSVVTEWIPGLEPGAYPGYQPGPQQALDGLPPREEMSPAAQERYDYLVKLSGELDHANAVIQKYSPMYRELSRELSAAQRALNKGTMSFPEFDRIQQRSLEVWDIQFDARGEATSLMNRIMRARQLLDDELALQ